MPVSKTLIGVAVGALILAVAITLVVVTSHPQLLRTQLFTPRILQGTIDTASLTEGAHTIEVIAQTTSGQQATSGPITIQLHSEPPPAQQRVVELPDRQGRPTVSTTVTLDGNAITREAERGVRLEGKTDYSSANMRDGNRTVVHLAHDRVRATHDLGLPEHHYLVELVAENDQAGRDTEIDVYVNRRHWKRVALSHRDNRYERRAVGILRNVPPRSTISFRLRRDYFRPTLEERRTGQIADGSDLNLHLDTFVFTPLHSPR
jgi:hypothetical protein